MSILKSINEPCCGRKVKYNDGEYTIESIICDPTTLERTLVLKNETEGMYVKECDNKIEYLDLIDESCIVRGDDVMYNDEKYEVMGKITFPNTYTFLYHLYSYKTKKFIAVNPSDSHKIKKC